MVEHNFETHLTMYKFNEGVIVVDAAVVKYKHRTLGRISVEATFHRHEKLF